MRALTLFLVALAACQPEPAPAAVYLRVEQLVPGCPIEASGGRSCEPCKDIEGTAIDIGGAVLRKVLFLQRDLTGAPAGKIEPRASQWVPITVMPEQDRLRYSLDMRILDSQYRPMFIERTGPAGKNAQMIQLRNPNGERMFRVFLGATVEGKELVCGLEGEWLQCSRHQEV